MKLGQRLRQARVEAGLSQRQLCGDVITRNMLSQIENGAARPSMDTLFYLAAQLGKPVSFFLEDTAVCSPNQLWIQKARAAYAQKDFAALAEILTAYQGPDAVFDQEKGLLELLCLLSKAEIAISENRLAQARQLLQEAAAVKTCYYTKELEQQRLLLLAQAAMEPVELAADDRPLLVRGDLALKKGDYSRCVALLQACENRDTPRWHYLWAEAAFVQKDYAQAAHHYHNAESVYPKECHQRLERCYEALGDYKRAYEYACKQR